MEQHLSRRIAGILGPSMSVVVAAEFPLIQPASMSSSHLPSSSCRGTLLFVAGLAILRSHFAWAWNWTVLVTLCACGMLVLGLTRLFFATSYHQAATSTPSYIFMMLEGALFLVGLVLTFKAYRPTGSPAS